jgi:hypothetical protein
MAGRNAREARDLGQEKGRSRWARYMKTVRTIEGGYFSSENEERSQMTQFSPSEMDISENKENLSGHDMEFVRRSEKSTC